MIEYSDRHEKRQARKASTQLNIPNTCLLVIKEWSSSGPYSHLAGGMKYHDGNLTVPITGRYYVYLQIFRYNYGRVFLTKKLDFTKTIIPLALVASEAIAHSTDSEPIRARGIIANEPEGIESVFTDIELRSRNTNRAVVSPGWTGYATKGVKRERIYYERPFAFPSSMRVHVTPPIS